MVGLSDQVPDRVFWGGKSFVKNGAPHGSLGGRMVGSVDGLSSLRTTGSSILYNPGCLRRD